MTINDYFGDWLKIILLEELKKTLDTIIKLSRTTQICPQLSNIFKAFSLCPLKELRAVFIGQDPYPDKFLNKPRATGILFGNDNSIDEDKLSPSLKVLKDSVINFEIPHNLITFDNSLEGWARQGILMINSALTGEMNRIGSHSMIWRPFVSKLLKNLSNTNCGIVYVLFGEQAQTFEPYINKVSSTILKYRHPAYYARTNQKMPYEIFREIKSKVEGISGEPLTWFLEEGVTNNLNIKYNGKILFEGGW